MRGIKILIAVGLAQAFAAGAAAQALTAPDRVYAHDPCPARVVTTEYGMAANPVGLLGVDLEPYMHRDVVVRVYGGRPENFAILLIGARPAEVKLPYWGTLLVEPTGFVPVHGLFDQNGEFTMPLDLARRDLVGRTFYLQGIEIFTEELYPPIAELSQGLQIDYRAGNIQPALGYVGPPCTAVLHRADHPYRISTYGLHAAFLTPSSDWELRYAGSRVTADGTLVYYDLLPPICPAEYRPTVHRHYADLGVDPGHAVFVMVGHGPAAPDYRLAAMVECEF